MGVVRIDDKLHKEVKELLKNNNNYQFSSVSAFIDNAVYEKLKKINDKK